MTKTTFVSIVGQTNAGKSSLLNAIIGEKVAIVSDKSQTTRTRITGILTEGELQYVFMDTPGVHKSKNRLSSHMMKAVEESMSGIDAVIMVHDITKKITEQEKNLIASFGKTPVILVLNKIDLMENKEDIAVKIAEVMKLYDFAEIIPISVAENDGVDIVKQTAAKYATEGPHYFPDEKFTDQPERVIAAEMVREQILRLMRDEVPHGVAVSVEEMSERTDRSGEDILDISAVIYCERDSHKGMIIGKGGAMLRRIGETARAELEGFFRIKVNLQCWVKVKEDWRNKEGLIRNFGLSNISR
ncbi:MAG: GTPase Era [Oscillospiraceae bacterium]|nr:GTPase Era [Oscillospiraceae bacterium]